MNAAAPDICGPIPWPFGALKPFSYDLIVADPPWRFRTWSAKGAAKGPEEQYPTMELAAIRSLPVGHLAAPDCILILWCTWPMLLDGGDPGLRIAGDAGHSPIGAVMREWGFRYVTGGAWHKRTRHGKSAFGTGFVLRSACEPFLVGVNGSPRTSNSARNIVLSLEAENAVDGLRREHSRKPEEFFQWCERLIPPRNGETAAAPRRLDLFSRQTRPGWDCWGDEAGKFDPVLERESGEHPASGAKSGGA